MSRYFPGLTSPPLFLVDSRYAPAGSGGADVAGVFYLPIYGI